MTVKRANRNLPDLEWQANESASDLAKRLSTWSLNKSFMRLCGTVPCLIWKHTATRLMSVLVSFSIHGGQTVSFSFVLLFLPSVLPSVRAASTYLKKKKLRRMRQSRAHETDKF